MSDNEYATRAQLQEVCDQLNETFGRINSNEYVTREMLVDALAEFARTLVDWMSSDPESTVRLVAPAPVVQPQPPVVINISEGAFQSHTQVDVEPVVEAVLPARKTTTTVQRDPRGLITKTTATETDA